MIKRLQTIIHTLILGYIYILIYIFSNITLSNMTQWSQINDISISCTKKNQPPAGLYKFKSKAKSKQLIWNEWNLVFFFPFYYKDHLNHCVLISVTRL